jgi:hypothetical protein
MFRGIGDYDLADNRDRAFAFDYDSSGKLDHLVLYRPGMKTIYIEKKNSDGTFGHVFASMNGINLYDLADPRDQVFAFDYDSSGKLDHLVLYRPGMKTIYILKNEAGTFTEVFTSSGNGIGAYDLADSRDRAFAFDYDSSGKLDHLVLYRPGFGACYILKNEAGEFSSAFQSLALIPPDWLPATNVTDTSLVLNWQFDQPVAGGSATISYTGGDLGTYKMTDRPTTGSNEVDNLQSNTDYYFSIYFVAADGISSAPNQQVVTTAQASSTPTPPPPLFEMLYLDYDSSRPTRSGSTNGPLGGANITNVVNKTSSDVYLSIEVNHVVIKSAQVNAGQSTGAFNGFKVMESWVGTVTGGDDPPNSIGPFDVYW